MVGAPHRGHTDIERESGDPHFTPTRLAPPPRPRARVGNEPSARAARGISRKRERETALLAVRARGDREPGEGAGGPPADEDTMRVEREVQPRETSDRM